MKIIKSRKELQGLTWEEESGLLVFLSSVSHEVFRFNERFDFGIREVTDQPSDIDGNRKLPMKMGVMFSRNNTLMPEFNYCLYSVLQDRALHGYIGIYRDGTVRTVKELQSIKDFNKGKAVLYEWLSQLVRASCEKIVL